MRVAFAVSAATAIFAVAPAYADAASHVQAAKRAERKGQWKTALKEWKAAYAADVNAEYLVGIGDAYSHLGNKAEAKKNYDAYLADPLALPATSDRVRLKVARLGGGAVTELALPGPGLDLPGASSPPLAANKRGKKKPGDDLTLPGMDLPGAPAAQTAPDPNALTLPGMDLPPPSKSKTTVATAQPGLDLPPPPAAKPPPPAPAKPPVIASTTPVRPAPSAATTTRVPDAATGTAPRPQVESSSGGGRKIAGYVALGVAVVALAGGGVFYAKGASAGSDLTGSKHSGAEAHDLLNNEKSDKTLGLVGLAAGLVAGGTAVALFAF
jgi:hypothetical protein